MEFFREQTAEEKSEFKPIMGDYVPTPDEIFHQKVNEKEKECTKGRKLFCARCARLDFQLEKNKKIRDVEETEGYAKVSQIKLDFPDLDDYVGEHLFNLISETDAMEPIRSMEAGQITRQIKIGVHKNYQCKRRKCGRAVFFSNEDLKEKK